MMNVTSRHRSSASPVHIIDSNIGYYLRKESTQSSSGYINCFRARSCSKMQENSHLTSTRILTIPGPIMLSFIVCLLNNTRKSQQYIKGHFRLLNDDGKSHDFSPTAHTKGQITRTISSLICQCPFVLCY